MIDKEGSTNRLEMQVKDRFKLSDAIQIVEQHPFESEEERWARFPENMPSWDKMKFERNALASILSKKAFDSEFNSKVTTLISEEPAPNVAFAAEYEEHSDALNDVKGERRYDILVTELPDPHDLPNYTSHVYLIENAYTCRRFYLKDGEFIAAKESTSLEKAIGEMFKSIYTESVAHFIEKKEGPEIEAFYTRYQTLLSSKYRVDSILDELLGDFEDDKDFGSKIGYSFSYTELCS